MKKLFMFATLLAILGSFASCSSDDTIEGTTTSNNKGNKTLTIQMSLAPTTRVDYTDDGTNLKAAFAQDKSDYITIFFRDKSKKNLGRYKLDCTNVSADGTYATFATVDSVKISAIPDSTTDVHMILGSKRSKPDFFDSYKNDLSTQDGTIADATAHMQWATNLDLTNKDNYEVTNGVIKLKNVSFDPTICTSILKLNITYPKGTNIVAGETPIKCFSDGAYSQYTCGWGNPNSPTKTDGTTTPFTTTKPAKVTTNTDGTLTATSYICIWPLATSFQVVDFSTIIGDVTYPAEYGSKRTTGDTGASDITGCKMYTVDATCSTPTKIVSKWYNDDAQTITTTGTNGTTADSWLTMSGSTINIPANTTGAPRAGSIVVDENGVSTTYKVVQIGLDDFTGSWDLYSRCFNPNATLTADIKGTAIAKGTISADIRPVTFAKLATTETLTDDNAASHTNNLSITGLYLNTVMKGCVEIDYNAQTVKFGVFFDRRSVQAITGSTYMAYEPELAAGSSKTVWANYCFAPASFGKNNYCWLWFPVISSDYKTFKYVFYTTPQKVSAVSTTGGTASTYSICGISCVKATANDPAKLNVGSVYDVIYQGNYNGSSTEGMYFTKTANAAKSYTGSGTITATGYTSK
jgi:hypothetical protein